MNADKTIVGFITIQSQNTILNVFVMNTKEARVQQILKWPQHVVTAAQIQV